MRFQERERGEGEEREEKKEKQEEDDRKRASKEEKNCILQIKFNLLRGKVHSLYK